RGRDCQGRAARDLRRSGHAVMAAPSQAKPLNRTWIWVFVVLAGLTTSGIAWEVWFNQRQQLTPEILAAARRHWDENRPNAYRVYYTIKRESNPDLAGVAPEGYQVHVVNGQVFSATDPKGQPLQPGQYQFGSMESLFDFIASRLQDDARRDSPRAF